MPWDQGQKQIALGDRISYLRHCEQAILIGTLTPWHHHTAQGKFGKTKPIATPVTYERKSAREKLGQCPQCGKTEECVADNREHNRTGSG